MDNSGFRIIGRGVYSLREACRLSGVPVRRIRRWTAGYRYRDKERVRYSPPVVGASLSAELGIPALDFVDLLEVRFLNAFREYGVSWNAIRIASERAQEILGIHHPFSSRRFSTDGRTILAEFVSETGDEVLLDLVRRQYELRHVVKRYLHGEIAFDGSDSPTRWWPVQKSRRIVIDPQRAFGSPVVDAEGVPTRVLAAAVAAEDSVEVVSELFEVDPISVSEAAEFEFSRHVP